MLLNDRNFYQSYEIIGGEKFMAPAAPVYHGNIILDLAYLFKDYFKVNKNGRVFVDDVDVYLLRDGKYFFDDEYVLYNEKELDLLTDEEKANVKSEVTVSIFEGLTIKLEDIFAWGNF